jgi:hypothetical protein
MPREHTGARAREELDKRLYAIIRYPGTQAYRKTVEVNLGRRGVVDREVLPENRVVINQVNAVQNIGVLVERIVIPSNDVSLDISTDNLFDELILMSLYGWESKMLAIIKHVTKMKYAPNIMIIQEREKAITKKIANVTNKNVRAISYTPVQWVSVIIATL